MLHNLLHNKVLHNTVVLLNVNVEDVPHVPESERITVHTLPEGFFKVSLKRNSASVTLQAIPCPIRCMQATPPTRAAT